jgi:hypothetical protein
MHRATITRNALITALAVSASLSAFAKLPAPSDEAKEKAAAAAAKTAWADKVGSYQLCQAMNRAAENFRKSAKSAGKEAPAATETPPCTDPGPFAPPVATPPLEAAGAHSPTKMATSPPSGKATAAELQGQPKK